MRTSLALTIVLLLAGCAATSGGDFAKAYDHKYNEVRLVQKESAGSIVGTSATTHPVRPASQHP